MSAPHGAPEVMTRMVSGWTVPIALAADTSRSTVTASPTTPLTTTTTTVPAASSAQAARRAVMVHAVSGPPTTTTTTTTTTSTTTTTWPPLPPQSYEQMGLASWYPEAPDGYCASPYLAFGTVITVTDLASGRSVVCTVDDRQAQNPPRMVDLSYDGFADLAPPPIGLIEVRLTW
jgi:rare lipoprotein A (peptidoglycan hydrolase)